MSSLLHNSIRTPDGTILESRHRHDYRTHVDANGKEYMVDGGLDYVRRSAHGDEIDLCVYDDDSHSLIRKVLTWGTYGKDGDQPLTYILLKDMETDHIKACLDNVLGMYPQIRSAMQNELEFRNEV